MQPSAEQPYTGRTVYVIEGQELALPNSWPQEKVNAAVGQFKESLKEPPVVGPAAAPQPTNMFRSAADAVSSGYQTLRGGVSRALNVLDMPGTRSALGDTTPEGDKLNPLPRDLTTGLAETTLGLVPGMKGVKGTAARVGAASGGATVGGMIEDKSPVEVATSPGVIGAVGGEVAGKGQEWVRRAWSNLTGALYARDAKKIAASVGDLVPTLKDSVKDQDSLRDVVMTGKGKQLLLDNLDAAYDDINKMIAHRTRPSVGLAPKNPTIAHRGQPLASATPDARIDPETGKPIAGLPPRQIVADTDEAWAKRNIEGHLDIPAAGGLRTFDQVRKELKESFRKGFQQAPGAPNQTPSPEVEKERQKFFEIMAQMEPELRRVDPSGKALELFRSARNEFRTGINIIDMLYKANGQSNRLFSPDGFQTKRLQSHMASNDEKYRRKLGTRYTEDELGQETFDRLAKDIRSGDKLGKKGGTDTEGISLGMFLRQPLTASGGAFNEALPRLSIPNYAGQPFTLTPEQQTLLDLLMQHGAADVMGRMRR